MATAEANICNKALARLGIKEFINDLSDDSNEAKVAALFYADERDSLLMQAAWPFATRRALLADIDPTQEPLRDGWLHVYAAPTDLLEPLYIWPGGVTVLEASMGIINTPLQAPYPLQGVWQNPRAPRPDQRIPFSIEAAKSSDGKVLLCDLDNAQLIYTSRLTDVSQFSPLFTDALAWHLASIMCMPLMVKPEIQSLCEKRAKEATELALARHFQGVQEDISPDSEMIIGRL